MMLPAGYSFTQYSDTLRKTERPDFVLDAEVDIVQRGTEFAGLRPASFAAIMSDVGILLQRVPDYVKEVQAALKGHIPLSTSSAAALKSAVGGRTSFARRLSVLGDRLRSFELTPKSVRDSLRRHGLNPDDFLDSKDQFVFGEEHVPVILDVLEGRYFSDDFTGGATPR
jgi:hypothetical protein